MIPGSANSLLLTAAAGAATGYEIPRSVRFNSADSAYLSRTPASAGNRKTWTVSLWIKRASSARQYIFGTADGSGNNSTWVEFDGNKIRYGDYTTIYIGRLETTQVFRDFSAWGHLVVQMDTTQATASNRMKLYWNGEQITQFSTATYPAQNTDSQFNTAQAHSFGRGGTWNQYYLSAYLADVHLVDGQALDPTSFGEFDTNNVWQPKAFSGGSYGTNGFHLDFADNSSAAALGYDAAGSNDWTVNNLSVTAGAGNDSLVDSPTNYGTDTGAGGEVRGNYCTWNATAPSLDRTLSNGNLDIAYGTSSTRTGTIGTVGVTSGKWYWEITLTASSLSPAEVMIGITNSTDVSDTGSGVGFWPGYTANGWAYYGANGNKYTNAVGTAYGSSYANGDVIGVAFDADNGDLYFYKNGTAQNSGTAAFTSLTSGPYIPAIGDAPAAGTFSAAANFGQRPFAYTAPSGYKALCTANLASTTITTSGSYTGKGIADGPFVYLNGVPTAMTVGGNSVTFGTDADKLSNGFKIRTTSTTYNQNNSTYNYTITSTGDPFKTARAQIN